MNARMADLVESRRRELRLEPKDLQRLTGLSGQALLNIRQGKVRRYTEGTINVVADALQWETDWYDRILAGDDPKPIQPGDGPVDSPAPTDYERLRKMLELHFTNLHATMEEMSGHIADLEKRLASVQQFVRWREAMLRGGEAPQT